MNRFFRLLLAAAVVLAFRTTAFSQITLTTADLANYFGAGKSWFLYKSTDTATMNVGSASTSAAQTWSTPSVVFEDTSRLDNVLPSSTPYSANFPGATYTQVQSISGGPVTVQYYAYYKFSNDSLLIIGSVQHESGSVGGTKIDSTTISHRTQLVFLVPAQVGQAFSSSGDTIYSVGTDIEVSTASNSYDAFGTVNLPNGSFGALRLTGTVVTKVYLSGVLLNSVTTHSISWFTESGNQLSVDVDTALSGSVKVYGISLTYVGTTPATLVKASPQLPGTFTLSQNYPNPFNPSTQIQFSIPQAGFVSLKVYDMLGREVATLVHQELTPSSYSITWNAANVASGMYLYKLDAGNYSVTKKMILMK
ncbi:MAG: T9SS type A sorting domain-containing protein [Bacteroidota bacterium]